MNLLVRISVDDEGKAKDDPLVWHLVDPANNMGEAALCTQEFFGSGESGAVFETKPVRRGGITCSRCLDIIKTYKAVLL